MNNSPDENQRFIARWERDLNLSFTESQWEQALGTVGKFSRCSGHIELDRKIFYQWYLTPLRLSIIYNCPNKCWRCDQPGTFLHIWWECQSIYDLWRKLGKFLSNLCGYPVILDPSLALLSINIDKFEYTHRTLIIHSMLAFKLMIARNWKSDKVPSLLEIIRNINSNCWHEKLLASASDKLLLFYTHWEIWLNSKHNTVRL